MGRLQGAIFDMDGLLLESESKWRVAEAEVCADLGLPFTDVDFAATMGMRMREVADQWYRRHPWEGPSPDQVADQVVDRVIQLCADAEPLPGVVEALDLIAAKGLRIGLCSSSDLRMIEAITVGLGLRDRFDAVHSAQDDANGKPHPEPYLRTAELVGLEPEACIAFEDSPAGCRSAYDAGMRVIAVPDAGTHEPEEFGYCDFVLSTMAAFDVTMLRAS